MGDCEPDTDPTDDTLDAFFLYHPPVGDEPRKYERIRAMARQLAELIYELTPASADQTAAIRKLRECVMTANAAIACTPHIPPRT